MSWVKKIVRKILVVLKWRNASVSVLLVDDRKMKKLNAIYLGHRRTTDVMAFGQARPWPVRKGTPFLGDVVVSLPTAKRQARCYGNTFEGELGLYLCHGILHLMGYDDRKKKDAERMSEKQQTILKKIGLIKSAVTDKR